MKLQDTKVSVCLVDTVSNSLPNGIVLNEVLIELEHAWRDNSRDNWTFNPTAKFPEPLDDLGPLRRPKCAEFVAHLLQTRDGKQKERKGRKSCQN